LPPEGDHGWRPEERSEREQQAEQAAANQQAGDSSSAQDRAGTSAWAPEGRREQVRGSSF
jgi:hypothetical protein